MGEDSTGSPADRWTKDLDEACSWLKRSERRRRIIAQFKQPMTASQLIKHTEMTLDSCGYALWELRIRGLGLCLNDDAQRSRLYWLTRLGTACQKRLCREIKFPPHRHDFPVVDWALYGWVCFSHRSAIIRALTQPLRPVAIKDKACDHDPELAMSADNTRDVLRLLRGRGIVQSVRPDKRTRPHYELTELGLQMRTLLEEAEKKMEL